MSTETQAPTASTIALLFPGQGSQSVGMGKAFYDASPAARAVFEEADDALGFALSKLIFEGPEDQLKLTEHTQPAILTMSIAALRVLEPELASRGLKVAFAAGHSLGEYSAHVAAGTFSFADAVKTVRLRGQFMQSAVPPGEGGMAAILGLDVLRINDICAQVSDELTQEPPSDPGNPSTQAFAAIDAVTDPANPAGSLVEAASRVNAVVSPANMNSPEQTVISGKKEAVERASELCKEAGAKRTVMLPVSAPFHCALMQPAQEKLQQQLESVAFHDPAYPVAANVDAMLLTRGPAVRDALVRQVTGAVRWVECIRLLAQSGATQFIEVGPGKVLCGLNRQIDRALVTTNVEDPASLEKLLAGFAS
ncbi:ACP S-malonyltransferase [Granulicella paludicola]|uniref:ACP S-malonyltransferase n=1 Tax=Granulicella paludicola TaxID=474951 RepID=UPI0021DF896D|nr:ACP S-malonyltransferase [Granulicella paludicola]